MHEHEQYMEAKKNMPKQGKRVITPRGEGKVVRLNPLSQKVSVDLGEEGIQDFDPDEVERNTSMNKILSQADQVFPYTSSLRREFHRQPELGFQEFQTAEIILRELSQMDGFSIQSGIAGTGIVALLKGGNPGKTILLRFDMDALPVYEKTGVEYASQNEGVMHACGHDGHMAIGLTAAKLLSENRQKLEWSDQICLSTRRRRFGWCPSYDQRGVLKDPEPDIILGLHLWNEKELGWLGISDGPVMSASETFQITVTGKGGHGGKPHEAVDPITAAAAIINSLQSLISREVPPLDSAVISVCTIHGGEAHNVIPESVSLEGTIRSFTAETRELVLERFPGSGWYRRSPFMQGRDEYSRISLLRWSITRKLLR